MDYVMEIKNVTYTYPLAETPALKNINVSLERGKLYGVVGANGSGKTTFCAMLRGFVPSFYQGTLTGEILVEGKPLADYGNNIAVKMGYAFQNPFTQISSAKDTVFEEVAYGLENMGVPLDEIEERVVKVMRLTDIESLAMKNPFQLSGGQTQRVALAAVIVLNPDILVIDEPTSQLDPESTESIFKIIEALKKQNKTVVLVEHKIDLLAEYADNILVLQNGSLIACGNTDHVLSDISLLDKGVMLPQAAMLGIALKRSGMNLAQIPVTEARAVELIREAGGGAFYE